MVKRYYIEVTLSNHLLKPNMPKSFILSTFGGKKFALLDLILTMYPVGMHTALAKDQMKFFSLQMNETRKIKPK